MLPRQQCIRNLFFPDPSQKLLNNELVLFLNVFSDGLCREQRFLVFSGHSNQALYLILMFLPDVFIDLHLELQAFGEVDPVHPF